MKILLKIGLSIAYLSSKGFCSMSENGRFMADLVIFLDSELKIFLKRHRKMLKSCPLDCTFL